MDNYSPWLRKLFSGTSQSHPQTVHKLQDKPHMGKSTLSYIKNNLMGTNVDIDKFPGESDDEYMDRILYEVEHPSVMWKEPQPLSAELNPSKNVSFEILKRIGAKNLKRAKAWVDSGGKPSDIERVLGDVTLDDKTRRMIVKGNEGLESYLERRMKRGKGVNDKYLVGEYLTDLLADPLYKYTGRGHVDGTNLSKTFNKLSESMEKMKKYGQRKKFNIVP